MSLLEARKISKDFGSSPLFASVDLSIEAGEKLALIGRNGCGKTSLLKVLLGLDDDYHGTVLRQPGLKIGYVPQTLAQEERDQSALSFVLSDVLSMRIRLQELSKRLEALWDGLVLMRDALPYRKKIRE